MTGRPVDVRGILVNLPLFGQLSADEIDSIAREVREIRAPKDVILFHKGDVADGFYATVFGQVKLALTSPQFTEKVVRIVGPGESFGEAMAFLDRPYAVYAQALTDSLILFVPRRAVFALMEHDAAFARKMIAGMSLRLHNLIEDVEAYSLHSCTQRVVGYLLREAGEDAPRRVTLTLPVSKTVIASRLNLTKETLSRVLHNLAERGLIRVERREVTIEDRDELRALHERA